MFRRIYDAVRLYLTGPDFREAAKRAARTFAIAFGALFVPGLLGFLHAVTDWAAAQGQAPFPDATGLTYLAVAGITAGVIGVVNLGWNMFEDATGFKLGRE